MIAKVRGENGFYNSIVFAVYKEGWSSEVLVFNEDYTALRFVKMWKPNRNIFIYNADNDGFIKKKKIEGYELVLENVTKNFFKTKINDVILDRCKELQEKVENSEWFYINNKADVDGLMYASCNFHDSYVKTAYQDGGKHYIHFDTTWGCEILFELEGNVKTNLFEGYGHIVIDNEYLQIYDSAMFFQDDLIYWVDDCDITSSDEIQKQKAYYFCAEKVKWKLIITDSKIWGNIKS